MNHLTTEQKEGVFAIFREGEKTPILEQHAKPNTRAYIHPIVAPDGKGILTEDTPSHHPWQHGLYVGLNEVNGIGYWMEGLSEKHKDTDGTFHPHPITNITTHQNQATWTVISDWHSPNQDLVLTETQAWSLTDHGESYHLDITWSLTANTDLTFGEYAYGGVFLRMPYQQEKGGEALNSEGQTNQDAETKRARWVSVSMPIEGRNTWAGIAMLDHPTNPEHPNPWRVDNQLGIVPSRCISGSWSLAQNETVTNCYRLYIFDDRTNAKEIENQWQKFAQQGV